MINPQKEHEIRKLIHKNYNGKYDNYPVQIITCQLSKDERETIITINYPSDNPDACTPDRVVEASTFCSTDFNDLEKKNWKLKSICVYENGTLCGGVFTAPVKYLSFRDASKNTTYALTEEQRKERSERLKASRKKQISEIT